MVIWIKVIVVFFSLILTMNYCNISWNGFSRHTAKMLQHMLVSTEYSDVTLVCADNVKLKAHKVVLSSCSPLLKAKIDEANNGEVEINLKEIDNIEMKLMLKFMYLGNAAIQEERTSSFLDAARVLQLKDISQDDNALRWDAYKQQQELDQY